MAPFIGGFVNVYAGYRWNLIVTSILVTVSWLLIVVLADETYAPILLARKNKHLTRTGPSLGARYKNAIVTPWKLLFTEPVLAFLSFYLAFLYAIFYALFPVSPRIPCVQRQVTPKSGLPDHLHPNSRFQRNRLGIDVHLAITRLCGGRSRNPVWVRLHVLQGC
jgi:MFS family permease